MQLKRSDYIMSQCELRGYKKQSFKGINDIKKIFQKRLVLWLKSY